MKQSNQIVEYSVRKLNWTIQQSQCSERLPSPPPPKEMQGAVPGQRSEPQAEGQLCTGGCFVSKVSPGHSHTHGHRHCLCGRSCLGGLVPVATEPATRQVFQHLTSTAKVCNLSSSSAVCKAGSSDQQLGRYLQLVTNADSRAPPWPADSEAPGDARTPRSEKHCLALKENETRNATRKGRDRGHLGTIGKTWIKIAH